MRGHQAIIELRRMGKKPTQAWIFLLAPGKEPPAYVDPEDMLENGFFPEVWVPADDDLPALDMRFLAGVTVHLLGEDVDRLREAFQHIRKFRPARIIASGAAFFDTASIPEKPEEAAA